MIIVFLIDEKICGLKINLNNLKFQ